MLTWVLADDAVERLYRGVCACTLIHAKHPSSQDLTDSGVLHADVYHVLWCAMEQLSQVPRNQLKGAGVVGVTTMGSHRHVPMLAQALGNIAAHL